MPARATDLVTTFAQCTGRYSAHMEHQWLIGAPAEDIVADRAAMIALLDAVMPKTRARETLAKRIEAKFAQARLLARASFNDDSADATWAATRASVEIGSCRALLLG